MKLSTGLLALGMSMITVVSIAQEPAIKNGPANNKPLPDKTSGTVSGTILKEDNPAAGATVHLLRAKDSAITKLTIAGKDGVYFFEHIRTGNYVVSVTAVGYQRMVSEIIEIGEAQSHVDLPLFNLVPLANLMDNVTVESKRPLIEQRIDRTLVNVEASITNLGTSALEVLEKAPGVLVDGEGNISLKGKSGVLILIDGRPTQLSGADIAALLRGMPSAQLDQVEIMTNPPARYDAAGGAGIINIKTKRSSRIGFNGSAGVNYSQGKYPKANETFNFNYREGKVNVYTNLGHNYQKVFSVLSINRNIFGAGNTNVDKIFRQRANRISEMNGYTGKVGLDFFATKKTTVGAVVDIMRRDASSINPNLTRIYNAGNELQNITIARIDNEMEWNGLKANFNLRHVVDKSSEITADLDYARYRSVTDLYMINSYDDARGYTIAAPDTLTGDLPQIINVYSARADYLKTLRKNIKFEAGLKTSIVRTDNNARYDSVRNGRLVPDLNRSNHFVYEENINAAYANLSMPLAEKLTGQVGLRLENTNATGRQKTTGEDFDRSYAQLFPTAFVRYELNAANNFGINYGRRILRPAYASLNPFIRFIDRYTYGRGNPNLKPSISDNFEISHTWKRRITTTLNYSRAKDVVEGIIQQQGEETYNMPENVGSYQQFGLAITANTPVTPWWTNNTYFNLFDEKYRGVVNNALIDLEVTSFIINTTQQFKLGKSLSAELSGFYRNARLEGVLRLRPVGHVAAGLSKQILNKRGTIRLTTRDIFYTQRQKGKSRYGNVDFEMQQRADTRAVTIGFTYNFSKGKKISPVKRSGGGISEEQNRVGQ